MLTDSSPKLLNMCEYLHIEVSSQTFCYKILIKIH
jgi:hypothetical protein